MEKITLYPQGKEIHLRYGEFSIEGGITIEKTRQEIESVISAPYEQLSKAMAKIRQWYEENQPEEVKYTLTGYSSKIADKLNKHKSSV